MQRFITTLIRQVLFFTLVSILFVSTTFSIRGQNHTHGALTKTFTALHTAAVTPAPEMQASSPLATTNLIMQENFESTWPSRGWQVQNLNPVNPYGWVKRYCPPHTGLYGETVAITAYGGAAGCLPTHPNNASVAAIYGPFDLSTSSSASMTFYLLGRTSTATDANGHPLDSLFVGSSIDGQNFAGTPYFGDYTNGPEANGYTKLTLDLTDRIGQTQVWITFWFESDSSGNDTGFTIDDVSITSTPSSPPTPTPTVTSPSTPTTTPTATPGNVHCEASIALRPNPDGYRFANWGGNQYDDSTDLDNATLIRMFGASNVCQSGNSTNDCVLSAAAREWRAGKLSATKGGHCYGMAVGSQLFFTGLENPNDYQSGVNKTIFLNPSTGVRAMITELWTTQGLIPANGSSTQWILKERKKPSEILDLICKRFQEMPNDPYVLGFLQRGGHQGHAVTPYKVESKGNNIYWLWIYDNNSPNTSQHFEFDLNQETWQYDATTNPAEPKEVWEGDINTDSLGLRPTSAHLRTGWACPFCQQTVSASGVLANTKVEFELMGQGEMLVVDQQGHMVGYDFNQDTVRNQIDGAKMFTYLQQDVEGQGQLYRLPLAQTNTPYTIFISGKTITNSVNANLTMTGPGYVVGLKTLQVNPNQNLLMTIRPDGRQITFNASQGGSFSPDIYLALDHGPNEQSYLFNVAGFELSAFKTVTVTLDLEQGLLKFKDDDSSTDNYNVGVLRITPQGQDQNFQSSPLTLNANQDAVLNFGAWNGSGDMPVTLGGLSTTATNTFSPNKIYLPVITH